MLSTSTEFVSPIRFTTAEDAEDAEVETSEMGLFPSVLCVLSGESSCLRRSVPIIVNDSSGADPVELHQKHALPPTERQHAARHRHRLRRSQKRGTAVRVTVPPLARHQVHRPAAEVVVA